MCWAVGWSGPVSSRLLLWSMSFCSKLAFTYSLQNASIFISGDLAYVRSYLLFYLYYFYLVFTLEIHLVSSECLCRMFLYSFFSRLHFSIVCSVEVPFAQVDNITMVGYLACIISHSFTGQEQYNQRWGKESCHSLDMSVVYVFSSSRRPLHWVCWLFVVNILHYYVEIASRWRPSWTPPLSSHTLTCYTESLLAPVNLGMSSPRFS